MKKRRKIILITILLIIFILAGCNQSEQNIDINEENTIEINDINNEEIEGNENEGLNYEIVKLSQGDTINNYFYSPNGENYLIEENAIVYDSGFGGYDGQYIILNENSKEIASQYFVSMERTLSPTTIIWNNNEEAFILGNFLYRYNINTNEKEMIDIFGDEFGRYAYNGNLNSNLTKGTFIIEGRGIDIYIYDINEDLWEKIYSYDHLPNVNIKSIWGIDDYIYFDEIIREDNTTNNNIKKYNVNTEKIEDFKPNAKILSISPNNRHMAYIDILTSEIIMIDLLKGNKIELPFSIELAWNNPSTEFVYVEAEKYIVRNGIEDGSIQETVKYDISEFMKEGDIIFNLQYVNNRLRFDLVDLKSGSIEYSPIKSIFYNGNSAIINEVTTYEIVEK